MNDPRPFSPGRGSASAREKNEKEGKTGACAATRIWHTDCRATSRELKNVAPLRPWASSCFYERRRISLRMCDLPAVGPSVGPLRLLSHVHAC